MWDMNDVVKITYVRDYIFHVEFDDGRSGEVDFSEHAKRGGVFEPLENQSFFQQAIIEGGTIAWPNGADIAPEALYEKVVSEATSA